MLGLRGLASIRPPPEVHLSNTDDRITRTSALEQHAQTLVGVVIAGLIAWVGMTSHSTAIKVAELSTRLESLAANERERSRKIDEQIANLAAIAREHDRRILTMEASQKKEEAKR